METTLTEENQVEQLEDTTQSLNDDADSTDTESEAALTSDEREELERLRSKEAKREGFEKRQAKKKGAGKKSEPDTLFLIENIDDIKLCKEEFEDYISEGYNPNDALRLAKLDKGLYTTSSAEVDRQSAASIESSVNRKASDSIPSYMMEAATKLNVNPETIKKYKSLVEGMK